ncbi:HAMP domain-containing sensor histidine kinase, partial [Streptomyces sp. SID3343]|uniref:sensor histidine kinase n=1 Tax=Streptomyces sp. SID3343 TaxID=2690260 RepID=UPI00136C904B
ALPPLSPLRPAAGRTEHEDRRIPPSHHDKYRVVAIGVAGDHGTYTVLVGASLEPADESAERAVGLLAVGCPVVVLLVAGATFAFVGRALTPVEAIRRKVSVISASSLDERVPVPPAHDEVARLAETMNAMLDRIETQVETRRRFVADAGHELRSPLTTLHTGLELLAAHGDLTARDAATVGILGHESERLSRLVDGLLLLARADEHGLRPDPSDVDLDDLVDAERRRLAVQHPRVRVSARIDPVRVHGDAHRLAQAIRNLADNAARHAASVVSFAVYEEDGHAVIEVGDDGPGVPEADRERVFERFVRLDASRTRDSGGTGLGLAIVREVVRAHGGTVRVGAREPTGALFLIELPSNAWSDAWSDAPSHASFDASSGGSSEAAPEGR